MDFPPPSFASAPVSPLAGPRPCGQDSSSAEPASSPNSKAEAKLPGGGGVFLLTDADDRPIQLASATDLRRALGNRLAQQAPIADGRAAATPRRRADLSQIVRRIRWRACHSTFEITWQHWRIVRLLHPDSYLNEVGFGPAWLVHVDPNAALPRFEVGKIVGGPPGADLGPFPTQADAARFVQILEDAFDLCRHHPILQQTPHGQPCAYFDMGRCSAPCNGSVPMTDYQRTVAEALAFATGERTATLQRWDRQMREAANRREFERAAAFKQRIGRACGLSHRAFERVVSLDRFGYLIVQRGGGTSRVKPFFVHRGQIAPGEPVRLSKLEAAIPEWISRARTSPPLTDDVPATITTRQELSEQIWLLSHFLFKRNPTGLFLDITRLPEPAMLVDLIRLVFGPKSKPEGAPPPPA